MELETLIIIYILLLIITIISVVTKRTHWASIIGVALFPIYFILVLIDLGQSSAKEDKNQKEDKGGNEFEADSEEDKIEVEYKSKLKEDKGVNIIRILKKEGIKENNSFSNIIILFLISAFIGCASYGFLSVTKIIDGFNNAEWIKNMILIAFFLSSFIIFLIPNLKRTNKL